MFNTAFSETIEDDQSEARAQERELLERAMYSIKQADDEPDNSVLRISAIQFNVRIWSFFLQDLSQDENQLPDDLKATLISIGIFILKHLQRMRSEKELSFEPVLSINETIMKGLR